MARSDVAPATPSRTVEAADRWFDVAQLLLAGPGLNPVGLPRRPWWHG
jgi:hypothetical protein